MERTDNRKPQLFIEISFTLLVIAAMAINVYNTKNVVYLYTVLVIMGIAVVFYAVWYSIFIKIHKNDLKLEDNYLGFYVSGYLYNKKLKIFTVILDALALIGTISLGFYYFFIMDFINTYPEYLIILLGFIVVLQLLILIKDITKINAIDRLDALTNKHSFSILDKKLTFALLLIMVSVLNILILSYKRPHFIVYYKDLVVFEIISALALFLSITTITTTRIYYSHFKLKQIEQKQFDTKFLEEIGSGRVAKVYKTYIPSLEKVFALKKLISNDTAEIIRFDDEYKLMSNLSHQNLVNVYSYDEIKYEYIMDYVPYTLDQYLRIHKLTEEEKLSIINQILNVLDYLHNKGILHRDLSLGNIMIDDTKGDEIIVKLTDFGIAKTEKLNRRLTRTQTQVKGTLIDPLLEEFKDYNIQNEIYSVGLLINVIYYQTDFKYDGSKMARIIKKCLDVDLDYRYKNISMIIKDLNKEEVSE